MACKLTRVPNSTDFSGPKGASITLIIKDEVGTVLIVSPKYADKPLVTDGRSVTLVLEQDSKVLELTYTCSSGTGGRGFLHEDCGGGQSLMLRRVFGHQPIQFINLVGE